MKNLFKIFLGIFLAILVSENVWGQQTLTVHDGTTTNNYIPMYVFYFDDWTRSQVVIPSTDLTNMAGGIISSITFYTTDYNIPYTTISTFEIYLKEVGYTSISSYEDETSMTCIYASNIGNFVTEGSGGKITFENFNFQYNGGNLLIACKNTTDAGWKNMYFYGEIINGASISNSNGTVSSEILPTQRNFIPKTTFKYNLPPIILNQNITQNIGCGNTYTFYDSGGENGSYTNYESYTATFTSNGDIILNFQQWYTWNSTSGSDWDYMIIYDGTSSDAQIIKGTTEGTLNNTITTNTNYVAYSGTMTIVWHSDVSNVTNGWKATITADCNAVHTYTIAYNANGGTGTMTDANSPYNSGSSVTVLSNAFISPANKEFDHWNTQSNNSGISYDEDDTFIISENITLYAIWRDVPIQPSGICEDKTTSEGTSTTYYGPYNSLWGYSFVEQIYKASELEEGIISSISFNLRASDASQTNDITIYMKHTTKNVFDTELKDFEPVTSSDIVFTGTVRFDPEWTTIDLDRPFNYNGNDNLVIGIHEYTSGYSTRYFYCSEIDGALISAHSDSYNPNPYNLSSYSGTIYVQNKRTNTKFCIETNDPLPISLLSFTASPQLEYNLVQWTTATEKNNDLFILEHSEDAIVFDEVYNVSGAGNSPEPLDYEFKDYCPVPDITYYRITQVDYDGSKTISEIIPCIRGINVKSIHNYFTITDDGLQVNSFENPIEIRCYDILGRLIDTRLLQLYDNIIISLEKPYFVTVYENGIPMATEKIFR